ncbi:hypothetical protein FPOAC2_11820 [Fusarium poae]|uniref:Extracellular membrane protein CFEM domain-containing protein n=1 Tax=Fusarium poae TaxID=36050 RepID=A0A1B8AEQ3_FUSPO|nr:hypothetical protein FPOAC1_011514 [Fusarium poae]KAG8666702.1 hypothetical protein FPOAC1_011514 [Fusarium poae]OBS18955.1 hypothetical protein FPOA_10679 [Fusarium poae]
MVRLAILATIMAVATSVQGATWCQCLFPDKSHCCVATGGGSCQQKCLNAGKPIDDGSFTIKKQRCNAGGDGFSISPITAQGRTQCETRT